jgi:hypothetical protein
MRISCIDFDFDCVADDDSEPILGEWLDGTMSPEEEREAHPSSPVPPRLEVQGESTKRSRQSSTHDDHPSLVPDKREPDGVRH